MSTREAYLRKASDVYDDFLYCVQILAAVFSDIGNFDAIETVAQHRPYDLPNQLL